MVDIEKRFRIDNNSPNIQQTVVEAIEENDSVFRLEDFEYFDEYDWAVETVPLDDIEIHEDVFTAKSNVALYEQKVAMETAQLKVGEGRPLVLLGEQNYLIDGYVRHRLLEDRFNASEAVVYRGTAPESVYPNRIRKATKIV